MSEARDYILPPELVDKARSVIEANRAAGQRIAVAESCTAGLVCMALTEIAGSSDVLEAGFVTYSDESKTDLLKVSDEVLETFGAVSIAVAWSMAQGALANCRADVAVAITGIAGPGGGSERKPVGTVVFAKARRGADPTEIIADTRQFGAIGRGGIRLQAALCALDLLMPAAPADAAP
jgi:nicotinamide-nucleotide amidase